MRTTIGIFIMALAVIAAGPLAAQDPGDCNFDGLVDSADVLAAAQHANGAVPMPNPRLLNCDVNASGRVTVIDALLIDLVVQGLASPASLVSLEAGDCSVAQGFDPGLSPADFAVFQDQFLGTFILGPPLMGAGLAACDGNADGSLSIVDGIHVYAATLLPMALRPTAVPRSILCGDCDQDGTVFFPTDANWMMAAIPGIGFVTPHARGFDACDVDNDAAITPTDILALSVGIRACDVGTGTGFATTPVIGSGTYTISPNSTGNGVTWTFLVGDSGNGNVVQGSAMAPVGASPSTLASIWATAISGLPGFVGASSGNTFTVMGAGPGVIAITGPNPYCLPGLGIGCYFNGEMVERDPDGQDPPVPGADDVTAAGSDPVTFDPTTNDWLPDGEIDASSVEVISQPLYGEATAGADGMITIVMEPGFEGKDAGAYEVCGFNGLCNRALFNIAVERGNQPPIAGDDFATVESGGAVTIDLLANDSDPDGDPIKVTEVSEPSSGTLSLGEDDGLLTYVAEPDFEGTVAVTYGITDSNGGEAEGVAVIQVTGGKGKR